MYVYIVECEGRYKIGYANDLDTRIRDMEIGNPFSISCTHFFECNQPVKAENLLHKVFKNKRIKGEWFALSALDINFIRSINGFSGGAFTWDNMPIDAYNGTVQNTRANITLEVEHPWNGEPVIVTENEIFDFLQSCWRRQSDGKKSPLSRRYFTQDRRPRLGMMKYHAIVGLLDDCSVIINRRQGASGQLSQPPREIMSIISDRNNGSIK